MKPLVGALSLAALGVGTSMLPAPALGQEYPSANFELQAEAGDSEVAVALGGWAEHSSSNTEWTMRFSTPLGEDETSADFITDGGLSGSTAVRASYGWLAYGKPGSWGGEGQRSSMWQVVVGGGVGHQNLEFRDPVTLGEKSVDRTPYAFSAAIGGEWLSRSFGRFYYVGMGVEHTREYGGPDERTLCAPAPPAGLQECFAGSFGEPEARDTTAAFLLGRIQGDVNVFKHTVPFAVEMQPAYDFESGVTEVAATLFLLPDGDGRLRGGLRFRWRSADDDPTTDDDRFTVGAFIGVPFSLYAPAGNR